MAIIELIFISIRLAVLTLWTSMFNWTAMFKEGGKWAGNYRPVRQNVIIEKTLKLILEEKLISQKVNLKIWQGFTKIIFIQNNSTSLFGTRIVRLGNYDIPKIDIFWSGPI